MEISTLIGLVSGVALLIIGVLWGGGQLISFFDASSIAITVGGSVAALFVAYSLKEVKAVLAVLAQVFKKGARHDTAETIAHMIALANTARKEGLLALEDTAREMDDPFLQKGVLLIVDGTDPDLVKGIMEAEIISIAARHQKGVGMLENLGAYGPAFGMLGTLIGLINMLKNLDDPSSLGPGMSTALITTFYGSVLANLVFIPMANKLKNRSAEEIFFMEMMLEGVLSIQAGENPRIIEEKLYSFLPRSAKENAQEAQPPTEE